MHIYISDTFLFVNTAYYADDTTLYSIQNNPKSNQVSDGLIEKTNGNKEHTNSHDRKYLNGLSPPIMGKIFKKKDCP